MIQLNNTFRLKTLFVFMFFIAINLISAQDVTTIQSNNEDISDNLAYSPTYNFNRVIKMVYLVNID